MKKKVVYPVVCLIITLAAVFAVLYFLFQGTASQPVESFSAIMCTGKSFDGENLEIVLDDEKNTTVKIAVKKKSLIEKLSEIRLDRIYGVQTRAYLPDNAVTNKFHNAEINTVQLLTDYNGYEKYFEIIDVSTSVKPSFVGTILEETTSYMIVEPIKDKADGDIGEKVKIDYGTDHIDYLYGTGRKVVVYFEGKPQELNDGMKLIKTDDISTEGFRDFELEVEPSDDKQKRPILSNEDIAGFTSFGHQSDTSLYYYGLDKVMITIKGFTMPLEYALEKGRITLNGIVAKCNRDVSDGELEELVYDDGGSQIYKYPGYTIIKYHTLDGNRDVYIGSTDMDIHIADK